MSRAEADPADPAACWAAVVTALETSNAWAWLDQVEFAGGGVDDGGVLQLAIRPKPAAAGVARLATAERLDRLAAQATTILGTRVRLRLDRPERGTGVAASAGTLGSQVAADAAEANAQRQEAMGQPLVRAVLSVFPDAVLVRATKRAEKADPGDAGGEPAKPPPDSA